MKKTSRRLFSVRCGDLTAVAATTNQSLAIGPENQLVTPTFDAVVRVLYNNPGNQDAGDGYFNGTGTIIGHHNVNGMGVLCVLTADHVVSTTERFGGGLVSKPGIAFGNSTKDSGNSPYMQSLNVMRNGPTGTSDYAVMGVPLGSSIQTTTHWSATSLPRVLSFRFRISDTETRRSSSINSRRPGTMAIKARIDMARNDS